MCVYKMTSQDLIKRSSYFPRTSMGAGKSQEKEPEQHEEKPNFTSQTTNSEAKLQQSDAEISLPHKCEEILKHADSSVDRSSKNKILEQLYAGVFLNQNKQKYWVERKSKHNCFSLCARDLSITWAEDQHFWHWFTLNESSEDSFMVAELLNVCWLEVHGRFDIANLSPGTMYEIVFVVKLKDPAYGWEVPVNLRLTLPDGSKQEHKEILMEKPRGKWIELPAGELKTSADKAGEMEFSLYEYDGGKWKKGLLVKGVSIRPKASVK